MAGGRPRRTGRTAGSPAGAGCPCGDAVRSRRPVPALRRGERQRGAGRLQHPGRRFDHRGRGRARRPAAASLVAVPWRRPAARLARHAPPAGRPHVCAVPGDRLAPPDHVRVPRRVGAAARSRPTRLGRVRRGDRKHSRGLGGDAPANGDNLAGDGGRDPVPYRGERSARPAGLRADSAGAAGCGPGAPARRAGPQGGRRRAAARGAGYPRPPWPRSVRGRDEG